MRPEASDTLGAPANGGAHLLTVAVEEYFHATAVVRLIEGHHRTRLEARLEQNVDRALALLGEHGITATFFVLGCVAESHPAALRAIVDAGHEVAARTWGHHAISAFDADSFREDVRRSRDAIEQAAGRRVAGFRIPEGRLRASDLWALQVLADEGFAYDSSVYPRYQELSGQPWRRFPHRHECPNGARIVEYPLSTWGPNGFLLPLAGGNIIRQLPPTVVRMAVASWQANYSAPFNMFFNIWEIDPALPRFTNPGFFTRIRAYRNLQRMPGLLRYFFQQYRFESIQQNLERVSPRTDAFAPKARSVEAPKPIEVRSSEPPTATTEADSAANREPFTAIIPCYNEEATLSYLSRALEELAEGMRPRPLRFIFVDDGSTDNSLTILQDLFAGRADCRIIAQGYNRGVAAAIMTGLRAAETTFAGTMDCDCTYDPQLFAEMIPLLGESDAVVTASPYHPRGRVKNVPRWRLALSFTLSRMYRLVLRNRLYTYTSCFRVYRTAALRDVSLRNSGFLGVAEILIELDKRGERIREHPATLESRILGQSKMRTLRTILGHLLLLGRTACWRLMNPKPAPPSATTRLSRESAP